MNHAHQLTATQPTASLRGSVANIGAALGIILGSLYVLGLAVQVASLPNGVLGISDDGVLTLVAIGAVGAGLWHFGIWDAGQRRTAVWLGVTVLVGQATHRLSSAFLEGHIVANVEQAVAGLAHPRYEFSWSNFGEAVAFGGFGPHEAFGVWGHSATHNSLVAGQYGMLAGQAIVCVGVCLFSWLAARALWQRARAGRHA